MTDGIQGGVSHVGYVLELRGIQDVKPVRMQAESWSSFAALTCIILDHIAPFALNEAT
jgi:hypothetical protein